MVDARLKNALERFLGVPVDHWAPLTGGYEARVFRVDSEGGPLAVHVSPSWRTRTELAWIHALAQHAAKAVSQVVCPIAKNGGTFFEVDDELVAVYPFIDGNVLDRRDSGLRLQAALLLAAIHRSLLDWPVGQRPSGRLGRLDQPPDPPELRDRALDEWWRQVQARGVHHSATHGDYYLGNLLCKNGSITGIIDWHEASIGPLAMELANATFELCSDDEHHLQFDWAENFVRAHLKAGGPISSEEVRNLLPLMRLWLREDARYSLTYDTDADDYAQKQIRAFVELASHGWQPTSL